MNLQTLQPETCNPISLLTWDESFSASLRQTYTATATIGTAEQHIRVFIAWWETTFGEEFQPEKITNYSLKLFQRDQLEVKRVAPNTWNNRLWAITLFTAWIEEVYGASFSNLTTGLVTKEQGIRPSKYRSLSEKEIHDLLQQQERNTRGAVTIFELQTAKRDSALITLMLRAGLRVAEAAALDITDIQINERSGSVRVRNGKGSKERIVPLHIDARNALSELCASPAAAALFVGKGTERLSCRQVERIVAYQGAQIGIPEMSPHWLRYSFAKNLERAGRPIEMIRDLLGHENIETTRKYLRSSFDELQSAVEV